MTPEKVQILKTEIANTKYAGMPDADVVTVLNIHPQVPNPAPQGTITIYNLTGTANPVISAQKFLNAIPFLKRKAISDDPLGKILYDNVMALVAGQGTIDLGLQVTTEGITYCKSITNGLTDNEAIAITGTTEILNTNWSQTIEGQSKAEALGLGIIEGNDVAEART